jgi:glucokinase-like ROK family protein
LLYTLNLKFKHAGGVGELATQARSTKPKKVAELDDPQSLSLVLNTLRSAPTASRPEVVRRTALGRAIVTKQIDLALELNFLSEGDIGESTGGRAPRLLEFNNAQGYLLVAELGATGMTLAKSDLAGNIIDSIYTPIDIAIGPHQVLIEVEKYFDKLSQGTKLPLWGIGVGLPGPVEFATGVLMSPPIMPGWDKYPLRERFEEKYEVPVWIDNEVNLMALGDATINADIKHLESLYIKIGTGIGAGIISGNKLHRGAQGSAGDIGHIAISEPSEIVCRCGNVGCLEAVAGGAALARDARDAVAAGKSVFLAERLKQNKVLTAQDVTEGARNGDAWSVDAINKAGRQIGRVLATIINFYNPSLVVIGGGVASAGDLLLAAIRESVYRRSLPLATRDLEIRLGNIEERPGLRGASEMVMRQLFAPDILNQWANNKKPNLPLLY